MANNEVEIPTKEEIAKLPRRAQVAFAARCARRVQPLFVSAWPDAPQKHVDAVGRAITLAEASAVSPYAEAEAEAVADAAYAAARARAAAAAYAAAAYATADAAYAAADAAEGGDDIHIAARAARVVADVADATATYAVVAVRGDFDLLLALAQREGWDDDTPVGPEVFGPMWPEGEPEGWPEEGKEERAENGGIQIEFYVDDDATDEEIFEAAAKLAGSASRVHCAFGGHGLKIRDVEIERKSPVREGVLQ